MSQTIELQPIGVLRTVFREIDGMPIQPCSANAQPGTAEIDPALAEALAGLGDFSHVILLYHLHRQRTAQLTVRPFADPVPRGVFATRAPARPNPIGLSIVPLRRIVGTTLHLERLDMLDGTPLLDVKPYVPLFDRIDGATSGWFGGVPDVLQVQADRRFVDPLNEVVRPLDSDHISGRK